MAIAVVMAGACSGKPDFRGHGSAVAWFEEYQVNPHAVLPDSQIVDLIRDILQGAEWTDRFPSRNHPIRPDAPLFRALTNNLPDISGIEVRTELFLDDVRQALYRSASVSDLLKRQNRIWASDGHIQ